ncbi:MAG: TonB-dependent receptor [Pseudomonadota bacterium]|nr:TonB-dependent receptor [Pseudomonadota bacterium]
MRRKLLILGLALVSCAAPAAGAEEEPQKLDEETLVLEPITVTATPLEAEAGHIAQPVEVLTGEDLRRKQALTIGETLAREPGISASDFGQGASRPVIRGLGGSRVRILEGGIGSMDVSNLSPDHAVGIDPLHARQIEILKGPSTLLYGSGAIGGIVNIVTDRIPTEVPDEPRLEAEFRYDSATNGRTGGGTVEAGYGNLALHFDGLKRRTSDYDIPGFGSINPGPGEPEGELFNSDVDTENEAGGASYIGDWGHLGFAISHYASNYGVPGSGDEAGVRIDLDQLRYDIEGEVENPAPGFSRLKMKLGHNDYEHQEIEPSGEVGTDFQNDEYEGRVEFLHQPLWGFNGALGVQVRHQDFEASGEEALTPPVVGRSVGVFWFEERDWDLWHFEAGARYENARYDADAGSPDVEHDIYSISGGALRSFGEDYSAGISVTCAQRAPSLEELYNDGPHHATATFERGAPALDPETANNLDLTLRKSEGRWTWRVSAFANLIEDFIFADSVDADGDGVADRVDEEGNVVPDGDLLRLDFVQDDAIFYGAEAETVFGIFEGTSYGDLDARLFADYVRGKLTGGDDLPRITPPRFGGGLDYRFGVWSGDFEVMRIAKQTENAPLETETDGYTQVDLGVGYTFGTKPGDLTLALRGTNLLDEEERRHTSFLKDIAPLPGRSVMLTLRASF